MNNPPTPPNPQQPNEPQHPDQPQQGLTQQVQYSQISARVPERVGRGVFATTVLVLQGGQEMVCDFLLRLVPPYHLASRVVVPYSALAPMISAIHENLENYRNRFGPPTPLPPPPPNFQPPTINEVYDALKISEEVSVAVYANTLMITHSAAEFCLDFILDSFPRPVVTSRIYMAVPQVPAFLDTLRRTLTQVQQRISLQQQQQHPPQQPPGAPPHAPQS